MFCRIAIGALVLSGLLGCGGFFGLNVVNGSGKLVTETRPVSNFHAVELAGQGDLSITQGTTESLTIETDDNIMPLVTTTVQNGVLEIDSDSSRAGRVIRPSKSIKYTLQVINLDSIELSGAGNVSAPSLKSVTLKVNSSGAGNFNLAQLDTQTLNTSISGAGNMTLSGQAATQDAELSGLGTYNAGDLSSANVSLSLSGAGNATVWATQTLDVEISGAGSVSYYGSPQVNQSISGVGTVKGLGAK